jgi:hypothetical protein
MEDTMRTIAFALLLSVLMFGAGGSGGGALAATGDTLIVTGNGVNVRYGPSTSAKVRMRVYRDQLVTELERQGDWVRAEIAGSDGASGWIHSSLLAVPSADQLARARKRATQPPRAGLPEAKPPAPPNAANPAPPEPTPPAPAKPTTNGSAASQPPTMTTPMANGSATNEPPVPAKAMASGSASNQATVPAEPMTNGAGSDKPPAAAPTVKTTNAASETPERGAVAPAAGPADAVDAAELARFRDSVDYLNSRSNSVAGVNLFDGVQEVGNGVVRVGATDAWASIPPGSQQSYANTLLDRWAAARGYNGPLAVQIVNSDGKVLLESKRP